ncbi:beta-N-acetylhexosaminidase [Parabacteroides sp. Marseille-P3160]|uniref:beta-N-acetylhexosaminidase n=1 Tax=Parabacteroides sp. Marseille-P3160 TaxID=1917887 RepID=UPI0009B9C901|nr:family 20 glycosylhydrolase [Parabacteroides sp. Marseille-P3160]
MIKSILTIAILIMSYPCLAQQHHLSLIPEPKEVVAHTGDFTLSASTALYYPAKIEKTVSLLNNCLADRYSIHLKKGNASKNTIRLTIDTSVPSESYQLTVDSKGVSIRGGEAGVFYATQTLLQLITEDSKGALSIPFVDIKDEPRFAYRGLMLDVGRYFFSEENIKQFIDLMAYYKLNIFHWHLTEDGGWRIEIKKHPELTRKGAWRSSTQVSRDPKNQDRIPHGGFYTQEQVRSIVNYASDRHITIVPEIEMPGHSMAALSVYPELSCTGGPFAVPLAWGIKEDIFCAGNENTFRFLEDVLTEVIDLFPGEYIHIGGDEAPKARWKACEKCQARIKHEQLEDEHGLQSYFIQRIEKFINSKGKKIIGWDEILEGGLAPNAAVMSWRGEEGGIDAANMGHEVIMSPNNYLYFDYYQSLDKDNEPINIGGYLPLSKVYGYEPYTPKITEEQQKYIKGVQGNIWMEYIHTKELMYYMTYPRALALAEIGWSPASKKDYGSFLTRLPARLADLDKRGILFRIPEPFGLDNPQIANGEATIRLVSPVEGATIYYTTDGSDPTNAGELYIKPIVLPLNISGIHVNCVVVLPSGRRSEIYKVKSKDF